MSIPRSRWSGCDRYEAEKSPRALGSRDSLRASLAHYRSLSAYFVGVRRERGPFQSRPRSLTGQPTRVGLKGAGRSIPPGRSKHATAGSARSKPRRVERPGAFWPDAVFVTPTDTTPEDRK